MAKIYSLREGDAFVDLSALPLQRLDRDWEGRELEMPILFTVAFDRERFMFFARTSRVPRYDMTHKPGDFVEGLWNQDVFEVFLRDPFTGVYQEFNLAPSGAWWSAVFSAPRQRSHVAYVGSGAVAFGEVTERSWRAGLSVPRGMIAREIAFERDLQMNVCSCLYGTQYENGVRYATLRGIHGETPDFHNPAIFSTVKVESLDLATVVE